MNDLSTNIVYKLIALALLLLPIILCGQKSNRFTIDTAKVLANDNLESFVQSIRFDNQKILYLWSGNYGADITTLYGIVLYIEDKHLQL